jgi:site-specific recombinase XerD
MTPVSLTQVLPAPSFDPVRLAAAAYLARFKGQSRVHTESDLRAYLHWCAEHGLDPLAATRPHIELHVRWMQEQRRYAASTVSRPVAVVAGFDRTASSTAYSSTPSGVRSAAPTFRRSRPPSG